MRLFNIEPPYYSRHAKNPYPYIAFALFVSWAVVIWAVVIAVKVWDLVKG